MFPGTTRPKISRGIGVATVTFFMKTMFLVPFACFLERLLKLVHAGNYLCTGLLGVLVIPEILSLTGHCSTCGSPIFLVAVTLSGIMRGVRTPMLLAKVAIFLMRVFSWRACLGFLGILPP